MLYNDNNPELSSTSFI